jgi:hypothetical protein
MANYNPNRVKVNRSYTYTELAAVFGVHKNTIAAWVKDGLPCLQEQRPFLLLGVNVKAFLQQQRAAKKQKCKPNEMFCMRCKAPSKPAENFVEYTMESPTKLHLLGLCERCDCIINKYVSYKDLERYAQIFDLESR